MKTRTLLGTAFLMLAIATAHAQTTATWNGGTSRDWATAANWSPGIPAEGDNVIIANTTTNGITLDASHAIGNFQFGTTGTRTSGFSFRTLTNVLTINGGLTASGGFGGVGPSFYGNLTIGQNQTWNIGGQIGSHTADRGVFIREVTDAGGTRTGVSSLVMNGDLTKTGTGQLVLAAATVSGAGNFIVNEGALKLNAGASSPLTVGGEGNITVNNAAQLFLSRNSGTMDITRPLILNDTAGMVWGGGTASTNTIASPIAWNGTHSFDVPVSNIAYISSGAWTGGGTVNRTGTGTLTLSGNHLAFFGTLNLGGGTTNLIGGSNFSGSLNVNAGTANMTGGMIGGTLTLASGATYNGETPVLGDITLNGGFFTADPTTIGHLSTNANLILTGTNTVTLTANPPSTAPFNVLSYTGNLTGGAGNLALAGGAANYRSPTFDDTNLGFITLAVGSESRTWTGATSTAWDVNTTTNWAEGDQKFFQLDAVTFGDTGAGTVAVTGTVIPSSITVNSGSDYTFTMATATDLIAGAGTLTKSGTGTLTLGGTNTFSGNIFVNEGTLKATASAAFGANGKTITVAAGATLDHNGAWGVNRDFNAVIAGDGVDGTGAIVNSTTANQNAGFRSLTLTADATIGGTARWDVRPITAGQGLVDLATFTLTKIGTNKIGLIDGTLANDGVINVNSGTLSFTRMVVGGNGNVNINSGATVQFENYSSGSFTKPLAIDGGTLLVTGNAFNLGSTVALANTATVQTDVALTLANTVSGSGNLTKTGTAALILANDATHTGGTTVSAGTLQIGAGGTTGSITGDITNNATVAFNRSDDVSYANVISGTGALTQMGPGTFTLASAQTYGGATSINGGTLKVGVADALPATTGVTLADAAGASLDLNGLNQEIRTLGGGGGSGGAVTNSGGGVSVLTIRPTGADSITFSGTLDGAVRLVVAGDKTTPSYTAPRQRLAGTANTYTGGTLVDGGTLLARTDGSLGAVPATFDPANITLQNNGTLLNEADTYVLTLDANRGITLGPGGGALVAGFTANVTVQGAITGAAGNNLTILENRNTVVLTANNDYLGGTIINGPGTNGTGRLQIGNGGTTGTLGTGDVTNDGALTFNRSDATAYNGAISGTGTLTQAGAGMLTLNGTSSYTGATTVAAGVLAVNGSIASSSLTTVNDGTLQGTGTVGPALVADVGHVAPGNSIGTLNVTGNIDIEGVLDIEYDGLAAPTIDVLNVTGILDITDATVDFAQLDNPLTGPVYVFATYGTLAGAEFDTVIDLPSGYTIEYAWGGNSIALIPEPSAALLAALGLLALRRRRR